MLQLIVNDPAKVKLGVRHAELGKAVEAIHSGGPTRCTEELGWYQSPPRKALTVSLYMPRGGTREPKGSK